MKPVRQTALRFRFGSDRSARVSCSPPSKREERDEVTVAGEQLAPAVGAALNVAADVVITPDRDATITARLTGVGPGSTLLPVGNAVKSPADELDLRNQARVSPAHLSKADLANRHAHFVSRSSTTIRIGSDTNRRFA